MNKISLALFLVAIGLGQAQAAGGVAPPTNPPVQDREKMWKTALARQPLAATAAFDTSGRLWLARIANHHLLVSFSDDKGKTFSPPVRVNSKPEYIAADGENRPKIIAKSGNVYISYTQSLEKPMSGDIRFSRSSDGGKSFSEPITVNDNREIISHRFDSMEINDKGHIYLAWLDKRDLSTAQKKGEKYNGAAIYYAMSDDGGGSFHRNIKIADHTCECCRTAMAMDTDSYPVVVWRHVYDGNIRDHALVKLDKKMNPVRLSHENWNIAACPHHGPSISIAADGIYHAAWFSNAPQQHGLFYAYSTDHGRNFSTPLNFGNFEAQAAHPYVLSLGSRVYLAWKEFDGETTGIFVMHSSDSGKSWSAPKKQVATSDNSDSPLLISENNKVYLSWNTLKEGYRLVEVNGEPK